MKKSILSFLSFLSVLVLLGGGILSCSVGTDDDDPPVNPFAGKTFYGSQTIEDAKYDVCELKFTSETDVTLVLYGQEADGTDKTEPLKYTVSDGKASVTYNGKTIETTPIADNTFTASLDGTDATKCSFSTTKGMKLPPTTPSDPDTPSNPDTPTDPDIPAVNPFTGKTFYGSQTIEDVKYDVCELKFTSETDVTLVLYGQGADGADKTEPLKYTVSDRKASVTYNGKTIETTPIADNTFTASLDGTDATKCSFSTTQGTKLPPTTPSDPDTPTDPDTPPVDETILKDACIVGINGTWDEKGDSDNRLTKVDDTFYTYTFTSNAAAQQFSIIEVSGSWNPRWCGNDAKGAADDPATTAIKPGEDFAAMVYSTGADPTHAQISGLSINSEYMITLKIVDAENKTLACKIELTKEGEAPTEYSWKGLTLKGAWVSDWSDTHVLTDDATQTFTISAANAGDVFGIFPDGAGNAWEISSLAFGTRTEMTYNAKGGSNSKLASPFEVGETYEVKLELTDKSLDAPKAYITITRKGQSESEGL